MERGSTKSALRQIRTLYELGTLGGLSDGQLLELFLTRSGADAEDAFAALVHRHGPMVLGVCRRMLRSSHDAEDAFQAAFLILVRRAAAIGRRDRLANWLHGVAIRTAREARRRAVREQAEGETGDGQYQSRVGTGGGVGRPGRDPRRGTEPPTGSLSDRAGNLRAGRQVAARGRFTARTFRGDALDPARARPETRCASDSSNAELASGSGPGRDCRAGPSKPRCRTGCLVLRSTRPWDMRPTGSHREPFQQQSRRWPKECSR